MEQVIKAGTLRFVLLSPLLMSVYLVDVIRDTRLILFSQIMLRADIISVAVFFDVRLAG